MARPSANFIREWDRNPEVLDLYNSSRRNFPDVIDVDPGLRKQFDRDAVGELSDQAKVLAATVGSAGAPAALVPQMLTGAASGALLGSVGEGTSRDIGVNAAVGAAVPVAFRALPYVWRAATSTKMRPGVVRVPLGSARGASVPTQYRGGVSLNRDLSDALQPTRLFIENTVDRTVAPTGHTLYFGMTGEETALLNPGKIIRYPKSPLYAARDRLLSAKMPTMPPEGRLIGRFPGMNTPAGEGPSRVVRAYETHAQTMRNLYKSPEARKALADALKTGDRTNPLVQLYDEAKEGMVRARTSLSEYQAKLAAKRNRDTLASALSGFKTDAELAKSLRAAPKKAPGVKVKAGELFPKVVLPWIKDRATHPFSTVWSTVSYPIKHPFKVSIPLVVAGVAASTVNRSMRDAKQDGQTEKIEEAKGELERAYMKFTADEALKFAMSDANALRAGLLGMREQALVERKTLKDRGVPTRARLEEYVNSVKDSPAFAELVSRAETEYAGRALNPDDYQREFRETFRDPASQALGEDYWREFGGAP